MFRDYIFSLLLFLPFLLFSQTPIADTNFEQFLVDEGIDTNGITGDILNADAATVTDLNITRNDIVDFTGLEAFINLVTLNAGQNQVPTIPLNTLTSLEELRFGENMALTALDLTQNTDLRVLEFNNDTGPPPLTMLDLSQNINLENLEVRTVGSITSLILPITATLTDIYVANLSVPTIDLSQLTGDLNFRIIGSNVFVTIIYPNKKDALKRLELSSINFPSVDVSEMIGLERLGLFSTEVETLLLPPTTTLTNLTVWHHDFGATLDLSPVPALTNLDIRFAETIPLAIDLTVTPLLRDVWLTHNMMNNVDVTQNPDLNSFRIYNNNLTSLDVTQNLNLNRLEAYQNQLPSIDMSQNLDLQYLNLSQNQIPVLDITNNVELLTLDIGENLFTGSGLDLTQNVELLSLTVDNNQIESLDITENADLNRLDISFNLFPGNAILQQFEDLIIAKGRLTGSLIANNNLLSGPLPDFYGLYDPAIQTRRFILKIEENQFQFGGFEDQHLGLVDLTSTMSLPPSPDVVVSKYTYAPQAKVNAIENPVRNAGESITLTTTVGGSQNHYRWFKDGTEIPDAPDAPQLVLEDLNTCDAGVYHTEITSDLVPFENANPPGTDGKNLLLVRNDITLVVNATKSCVTLDMPLTNVPINSGIQWNDNPGACGYKISIGTASGNDDILPLTDVGEVTVYNHSTDYPTNQDIFVTIVPYYDDGDFTCTEQSFRSDSSTIVPGCTALLSPLNGNSNVAVDLSRITWNPANGADEYNVTVSSPSGANDVATTVTDNFLDFNNDFDQGETVTVTIIPANTIGNASACAPETFTIMSGTPVLPVCTNLSTPVDGANNVSANLAQIFWDAIPSADGYRLTINGSASNVNDVTDLLVAGTSHPLTNDFVNGETVTVTIVPFNTNGDAMGCTSESFTIVSATPTPLNCTALSGPMDGDNDVAVGIDQIFWDAVPSADGYRLTIDGSASNVNDVTDLLVAGTSHPLTNDFVNGETVTVTIVPFNTNGDAAGCGSENFTIVSATPSPPDCTMLSSPLDGAIDVAVDTELSWNPVNGAEGYRIAIGTTVGASDIFEGDVALLTSYTPNNTFAFATEVFVTITPYNIEGNAVDCASESFTTIAAPKEPPIVTDNEILFGFSPDGDGINEYWEINGIESYPDNVVSIFNRWGDLVFKMEGYDNMGKVFDGQANQMTNLGAGELPEGTYFFQIRLPENHDLPTTQGYLVLKR